MGVLGGLLGDRHRRRRRRRCLPRQDVSSQAPRKTDHIDRRPPVPEPLRRPRAGVFLRRDDRGAHRGALEDPGAPRHLADLRHAVQEESDQSLPEIARQLNVDAVVEGSVQRVQDDVRITAQLVRADPEKHMWANTYTRELPEHPRPRERNRPDDRRRDTRHGDARRKRTSRGLSARQPRRARGVPQGPFLCVQVDTSRCREGDRSTSSKRSRSTRPMPPRTSTSPRRTITSLAEHVVSRDRSESEHVRPQSAEHRSNDRRKPMRSRRREARLRLGLERSGGRLSKSHRPESERPDRARVLRIVSQVPWEGPTKGCGRRSARRNSILST